MSTKRQRSLEAEACESIVDVIDAWVHGESDEATAVAIRLKLPRSVLEAMDDIARRGPVPITPAPRVAPPQEDVIEAELDEPKPFEPDDRQAPETTTVRDEPSWDPKSYEVRILDHGFTAGAWSFSFEAIDAPRLEHQTRDPVLSVTVALKSISENTRRLARGQGTSLARLDEDLERSTGLSMLGPSPEAAYLRHAFGATVDTGRELDTSVPIMPTNEEILERCRKELGVHLEKVRRQRERHRVTERVQELVGRTLK